MNRFGADFWNHDKPLFGVVRMARTCIVRQALFQTDQVDEREPVARTVFQLNDNAWEITSERSLELGLLIVALRKREGVRLETG